VRKCASRPLYTNTALVYIYIWEVDVYTHLLTHTHTHSRTRTGPISLISGVIRLTIIIISLNIYYRKMSHCFGSPVFHHCYSRPSRARTVKSSARRRQCVRVQVVESSRRSTATGRPTTYKTLFDIHRWSEGWYQRGRVIDTAAGHESCR